MKLIRKTLLCFLLFCCLTGQMTAVTAYAADSGTSQESAVSDSSDSPEDRSALSASGSEGTVSGENLIYSGTGSEESQARESETQTESGSRTESTSKAESTSQAESASETESGSQAESASETGSGSQAESASETESGSQAESEETTASEETAAQSPTDESQASDETRPAADDGFTRLKPSFSSCSSSYCVITLNWKSVAGADGYMLYRQNGNQSPRVVTRITDPGILTYTDTVSATGTWTYILRAFRIVNGTRQLSAKALKSFSVTATGIPSTLTLKSAYTLGFNTTLTWQTVKNASGYLIYRKLGSGSWQLISRIRSKSTCTYMDTVSAKGTYSYTVRPYRVIAGKTVRGMSSPLSVKSVITGWDIQTNYDKVAYVSKKGTPKGATIKSGGCAPTSVGNVLRNYVGIEEATTVNVAALAIQCGARRSTSGTDAGVLLAAAQKKWGGFDYTITTSSSKMKQFMASGGMVVACAGNKRKLLTTASHYVVIQSIKGDTVTVFDPAYWDNKWTQYSSRVKEVKTTSERGRIQISCKKSIDVFVRYYLIRKK